MPYLRWDAPAPAPVNGELFESSFGSDERRELIDDFVIRGLHASLRQGVAG